MFSIRNPHTGVLGAAAAVVLATFALTACTDASGVRDDGAAQDVTVTASASPHSTNAAPAPKASTSGTSSSSSVVPTAAPKDSKAAANPGATKAPAAPAKTVTCQGSNTKVVASPLNRPVNHMLLTVTNTGSRTCFLYAYPELRFGDAQAVPPVIEDSKPQAVVTLEPGESGYASVGLAAGDGSGTNGRTEKSLTVYFQGRSSAESVDSGAHPQLPAGGLYIDDSLNTTYWQQSLDDTLTW